MFGRNSVIKLRSIYSETNFKVQKRNMMFPLSTYEPPYLETPKSKIPMHEALTIQVRGYDYPQLENFQGWAHGIANYLGIDISHGWAHPAKHYKIDRYKPRSTVVETQFHVVIYERNIKLINVEAVKLPLYIELIQAGLPEGSTLNVLPYSEEYENEKYVPDHELISKMKELDEMGGPPPETTPAPAKTLK